jgi:hypothetical protein
VKLYCPSCGNATEFRYDDSFVRVCDACRSLLVRTDRGIETFGQFADLTPARSGLSVGQAGVFAGTSFVLTGRCEYRHPAGGSWEEWYMKLADGRWGWLAQAQGEWVVTFPSAQERALPPFEQLSPGMPLALGADLPELTIGECNVATLSGAEGEIPFVIAAGEQSRFADLADARGRFATLDYGAPGSTDPPSVYIGRRATLAALGLALEAPRPPEPVQRAAERLGCPNCGGSIELRLPGESQSVVCPYCGAVLACEGALGILALPGKLELTRSPVPLGVKGRFFGDEYTVIGRMKRQAAYEGGIVVRWDEFLLHSPAIGYRWLVYVKGHWSFVAPLPAGAVQVQRDAHYAGKDFSLYDQAKPSVTGVWGEFYWKVSVDDTVATRDFIAPPLMLSEEASENEINWSLGLYQTPAEVSRAFGVKLNDWRVGVSGNQPFPHRHLGMITLLLALAFVLVSVVLAASAPGRRVYDDQLAFDAASRATDVPEQNVVPGTSTYVFFTQSFPLTGGKPAAVRLNALLNNSWAYALIDLIDETSGEFVTFDQELSYYYGSEGGEFWSEGNREASAVVTAKNTGPHLLRLEVQVPADALKLLNVTVEDGVFVWKHFLWALAALTLPALALGLRRWSFETKRWSESDHAPSYYSASSGSDDD